MKCSRTRRATATPTIRPVINLTRNMNLNSRLNARPRYDEADVNFHLTLEIGPPGSEGADL